MSRIGKSPITIPSGVTVEVTNSDITVKGPKGELKQPKLSNVTVAVEDGSVLVSRKDDEKLSRSQHGLMRTLIQNMVTGVTDTFNKKLEVNGVGYKVKLAGNSLNLSLGYSHEINFQAPEGIELGVDGNVITVTGIDKQKVGQTAAEIRELRKPEPYKGKGIKYIDEHIIRKAGKAAGSGD